MVFAWAPLKLFADVVVKCPKCRMPARGEVRWSKPRTLHMQDQDALFVATRHSCLDCKADRRGANTMKSRCYQFCAGSPEALALMPAHVQAAWPLVWVGDRTLCDGTLVGTIRAWATRTSWAKIAAVLNELRATHHAQLVRLYGLICDTLQLQTHPTTDNDRALTSRWVSDVYEHDYKARAQDIATELLAEVPGNILAMDWTRSTAARCSGRWMFNAMDCNGKLLNSILTNTTSPNEVAPVLHDLKSRGMTPKAIYVDDECCGLWKALVRELWPGVPVFLDAFHAIRRLTQTTASTRHPWHADFCGLLSQAMFTYDADLSVRFRQACQCAKVTRKVANRLKVIKSLESLQAKLRWRSPLMRPLRSTPTNRIHKQDRCLQRRPMRRGNA